MMISFDVGMDTDERQHSGNTHSESSNSDDSKGDIVPYLPTACNRDIYIDTRRVLYITTVTWWSWRILKIVVVTW